MEITTTMQIPGMHIEQILEVVSGVDGYTINGNAGAAITNQASLYTDALSRAKLKMEQRATAISADAVIGVTYQVTTAGNLNTVMISAIGTAVKLRMSSELAHKLAVEAEKRAQEEALRLKEEEEKQKAEAERAAAEAEKARLEEAERAAEKQAKAEAQKRIEDNKDRVRAIGQRTAIGLGISEVEGTIIAALGTANIPLNMGDIKMYMVDIDTMELLDHVKSLQNKGLIVKTEKGFVLPDTQPDEDIDE